jgi:capsular polysaccharide biosynthesis protein
MEETISLKDLMETVRKRIFLILSITIIAVIASAAISFFVITPIYQTSTQLLVNQAKSDQAVFNPAEIQTNLQLINTYNVIIKSPKILDKVNDNLKLGWTTSELNSKITVQTETDSQVVNLSVQDEDPYRAAKIANETAEVFQQEIPSIMNVDNVSVLSKAEIGKNQAPIKPQPLLNIAIALVVGLMVGVGIAFILEYLDNSLKTEQDIENYLGLPVLGTITTIKEHDEIPGARSANRKGKVRGESYES